MKADAAVSTTYIPVIDSIRFLAALWVFLSHYAGQMRSVSDSLAARLFGISFDGVSAVVLFFIISGFCVHLPYTQRTGFHVGRYYLRRFVRIGLPLVACLLIMHILGGNAYAGGLNVLWSVYAELVYYALYPLIFRAQLRWGFLPLLLATSALSLAVILAYPQVLRIWEFGMLTWVWGLPVWIAGACLADRFHRGQLIRLPGKALIWRMGIWLLSISAMLLLFHSPVKIGYPVSMALFTGAAWLWISSEVSLADHKFGRFSILGQFTYSLYLMHNVVIGACADLMGGHIGLPALLGMLVAVIFVTAAFFYLIERPAHRLARWLAAQWQVAARGAG